MPYNIFNNPFEYFDFIEWFDLYSNATSLFQSSSINEMIFSWFFGLF